MAGYNKSNLIIVSFIIVLVAAGAGFAGWKIARNHPSGPAYSLLDPSVTTTAIEQNLLNFEPLRQDVEQYLKDLNLPHSFYFEYLPNGISIGDGEDQTSLAASLMKTPVVMDLYKLSELHKLSLDDKVTVTQKDISTDNSYGNSGGLKAGDSLSLKKAAQISLHNSDNTTINIIRDKILPLIDDKSDAIESLDISYTLSNETPRDKILSISSRSYSSILKCLYYSCFLEPQDSQQLLNYLSGSAGQTRLMAGISKNIVVAHKIGSGTNTQSDCGIVYEPHRPYLICLLLSSTPENSSTQTDAYFKHVAKMTDDYIVKAN